MPSRYESAEIAIRRRWLPGFSLRAFLLIIVGIGAAIGLIVHKAREQGVAVGEIERLGGSVSFLNSSNPPETTIEVLRMWCGERRFRNARTVLCWKSRMTDAALVNLDCMTDLKDLDLDETQVTDTGMRHIERLSRLQVLSLNRTRITDAGLIHLRGLTHLWGLDLGHTQVTDDGLIHLQGLTNLRVLYLDGTTVTDVGLKMLLRSFPKLQGLDLGDTQVTDAGLELLQGMQGVRYYLVGSKITDATRAVSGFLFHGYANSTARDTMKIPRLIYDPLTP